MKGAKSIILFTGCILAAASLEARIVREDTSSLHNALQDLRYEFKNHEEEIRLLSEKLEYQDSEMSSLREMVRESVQINQDGLRDNLSHFDKRINGMESTTKNAAADLKKLQTHANESGKALQDFQNRISDMESRLDNMQTAMESLLKALNIEVNLPQTTYVVQPGDTLGGIAQKNHSSIKAIRERNQLKNNIIHPGQKLEIPQGK